MLKNLLIVALMVVCGALIYTNYFAQGLGTSSVSSGVVKASSKGKVPNPELIKNSQFAGISLDTPIDGVDALIEKTDFTCRKNDNQTSSPDAATRAVFWRCNNKNFRGSQLTIDARGDKIIKISRSGQATKTELDEALAQIDMMHAGLSSRKGLNMTHTERSSTFSLRHRGEDSTSVYANYRIQLMPRDGKPDQKHDGMLIIQLGQ